MLHAPPITVSAAQRAAFEAAWRVRDLTLLPTAAPRWLFLHWLTGQGLLLHGSPQVSILAFEPRTPHDLSPDDFSKRTGVYAASDALWAMMYALRDPVRVQRMLNVALRVQENGAWSTPRYFLSLAPKDARVSDGRSLLTPGVVYVLPAHGFEAMPPYDWPGLGLVHEPHWVNPHAVTPLLAVPVTPADFPLPVRTHGAARVDALCQSDPWGFPWLP